MSFLRSDLITLIPEVLRLLLCCCALRAMLMHLGFSRASQALWCITEL